MKLVLERQIHFRESMLIFLGIWGADETNLGVKGAKEENFQGAEEKQIRELGRRVNFFREQGAKTPTW